jgi:hypothetical protein
MVIFKKQDVLLHNVIGKGNCATRMHKSLITQGPIFLMAKHHTSDTVKTTRRGHSNGQFGLT